MIEAHEAVLREKVFETHKWPQYELLLSDIKALAKQWSRPVIIERTMLYGGNSLIKPFFDGGISIDCSPNPIDTAYNQYKIEDKRFILCKPGKYWVHPGSVEATEETAGENVIVPNLLHHVPDPFEFLDAISEARRVYIFDHALEEIHQAPNCWGFFTHYGIQDQLRKRGFHIERVRTTGNAATVAAFFMSNLAEHLMNPDITPEIKGMADDLIKYWPDQQMKNLKRDRTETIMAWSVLASK